MRKTTMLSSAVRRAIQREMAALVKDMGSQVNVAAALDVAPYTIGRAEKQAVAGPLLYEKLLGHLQLDRDAFLRRHGIVEQGVKPVEKGAASPPPSSRPPTNHLAEALSVYEWNPRLKASHRNNIVKQAIAGRERHDVDPPVEVWTMILRSLEALMLEITPDLEKMAVGGSQPLRDDAAPPPPVRESLIVQAPQYQFEPASMLEVLREGLALLVHEIRPTLATTAPGHHHAPMKALPPASPHGPVTRKRRNATGPHKGPSATDTK